MAAETTLDLTYQHNPECRDGKHANCDGTGWDLTADMPTECRCQCHVGKDPDATCVTCGHFFNREVEDQVACSVQCEILNVHDEQALNEQPQTGIGGF